MVYKNAFFQMLIKPDAVYIKYFPPKEGGNTLNMEEFSNYMDNHSIKLDYVEFSKTIVAAKEPLIFKTNTDKTYPESEKLILSVSEDNLRATCRFIPPSTGGRVMSKEDIIKELNFQGIKYGIDEKEIERYLANKEYCTDYVMAVGLPAREGSDAEIIYKFNTNPKAKPKENPDGSVDFYSLDIISSVEAGDELAELIKEDEGESGIDVRGVKIKPRQVKKLSFRYGRDISISEDGRHLISNIAGHATLEDNDKVKVSNVFVVKGNVDLSTGDIRYDGSVEVKGNVTQGFKIYATKDVIIAGTAEGVEIVAGGQIILKGGIRGMGRGSLTAGTNVIAKFLESTTVRAGGYVSADAILSSDISAKGDIIVNSNKGYVNGGTVRSATLIRVKSAGSEMGTKTNLEVGIDPSLTIEHKKTQAAMDEITRRMDGVSRTIEAYSRKLKNDGKLPHDKLLQFKTMVENYKKDSEELNELSQKFAALTLEISEQDGGIIEVARTIYPGVKITIVDSSIYIREVIKNARFIREGGEVRARHLN